MIYHAMLKVNTLPVLDYKTHDIKSLGKLIS
jgi:hypothetical protein